MVLYYMLTVTRMHSSRMRTARSSGRPGRVSTRHPPGPDSPPGADPLGTRHPQALRDQAPPPPGPGTPREQTPLSCEQGYSLGSIQ